MSNKPDIATCSLNEALEAIKKHSDEESWWRTKAITLLQLVGEQGIDPHKHAFLCREHARKGLEL